MDLIAKEKARELADILKEDFRQIKEVTVEIMEEERALHGTDTSTTLL